MPIFNIILFVLMTLTLNSCGGGGSSSPSQPITPATNTAPTITNPGTLQIVEGQQAITNISVADLESGSAGIIQSISGGADAASFSTNEKPFPFNKVE